MGKTTQLVSNFLSNDGRQDRTLAGMQSPGEEGSGARTATTVQGLVWMDRFSEVLNPSTLHRRLRPFVRS